MIVDGFNPSFTRHALESLSKSSSPVGKIFIGDVLEKINGVRGLTQSIHEFEREL